MGAEHGGLEQGRKGVEHGVKGREHGVKGREHGGKGMEHGVKGVEFGGAWKEGGGAWREVPCRGSREGSEDFFSCCGGVASEGGGTCDCTRRRGLELQRKQLPSVLCRRSISHQSGWRIEPEDTEMARQSRINGH